MRQAYGSSDGYNLWPQLNADIAKLNPALSEAASHSSWGEDGGYPAIHAPLSNYVRKIEDTLPETTLAKDTYETVAQWEQRGRQATAAREQVWQRIRSQPIAVVLGGSDLDDVSGAGRLSRLAYNAESQTFSAWKNDRFTFDEDDRLERNESVNYGEMDLNTGAISNTRSVITALHVTNATQDATPLDQKILPSEAKILHQGLALVATGLIVGEEENTSSYEGRSWLLRGTSIELRNICSGQVIAKADLSGRADVKR